MKTPTKASTVFFNINNMESILKEMYKKIPIQLIRNKTAMTFYISKSVFYKEKHNIINGRFMGVDVIVDALIPKDVAFLTKTLDGTIHDNLYF